MSSYDAIRDRVINGCKATVGYHEAKDKCTYLTGAKTAASRAITEMMSIIESKDAEIRRLTEAQNDLHTLTAIIARHTHD